MRLRQGQVWKTGDEYLRIVHLERLEVKYKSMRDLATKEGEHHHVTKKQFCRLIKNATLLETDASGPTQVPADPVSSPGSELK